MARCAKLKKTRQRIGEGDGWSMKWLREKTLVDVVCFPGALSVGGGLWAAASWLGELTFEANIATLEQVI